jgi:MPBQ/MSBQ methyltransferase
MDPMADELAERLKKRLFASISNQIDAIAHVPEDVARIAGDPVGWLPVIGEDPIAPESNAEPAAASLADAVNRHYDRSFYDPDGMTKLIVGDSGFRNIGYWGDGASTLHAASERLQERLLALLPADTRRVLDVACGMGASTARLCDRFGPTNVSAINISARQVESARAAAPGADIRVMDAVDLAYGDAAFDAVMCIEAAFHFDSRRAFFAEAFRVLRPGGALALSDVLFTSAARLAQFPVFPGPENHVADAEGYRGLLADAGFRDIVVEDRRREIWEAHFLHVTGKLHAAFAARELPLTQLTDVLWTYYLLDAITGPCLMVAARRPG